MWKNISGDVDYFISPQYFSRSTCFTFCQQGASGSLFVWVPHYRQPLLVLFKKTGFEKKTYLWLLLLRGLRLMNLEEELHVEHPGLLHLNVVCRVHSSRQKSSKDDQYFPQVLHVSQTDYSRTVSRFKLNRICKRNITCM